uniref:Putative CP n=1 Tax=Camellia cryptic virus 2 TaxID=2809264 RepID=A0A890CAW5_9VIRU|nr:putative CP [Camellia cryptic virus 2]
MANEGNDVLPIGHQPTPMAQNTPQGIATRSSIRRAVDYLLDYVRIGSFYVRVPRYRRYVDLKRQELFNSLLDLYTQVFRTYWTHFRRSAEHFEIPATYINQPQRYCAAVYISAWFHDLYVSNRLACYKLSDSAYNEHYYMDLVHKSREYDAFLVALNAQIRPTNIKLTHEDTLFIPRIRATIDDNALFDNFFDINGWSTEPTLLSAILYTFKDRKLLKMEPLSETSTGRPGWLLDWHDDNLAYAWFPTEGNYSFEDVTLAFIIGVACTPKLAPRDYDEWQLLPGNVEPANRNYTYLRRLRPVAYHGAIEIRTYETRTWRMPQAYMAQLVLTATPAQQQPPPPPPGLPPPPPTRGTGKRTRRTQPQGQTGRETRSTGPSTREKGIETQTSQSQTSIPATIQEGEEQEEGEATPETEAITEGTEQIAESTPAPATITGTTQNVNYTIEVPIFRQVRIVDYLYHARVINVNDMHSRIAALKMIIYLN